MKVFDLHCDTLSELRYAEKAGVPKSFAQNDLHIDLQKLKKGDYMLQCFAAFVNLGDKTPGADPLVTALEEIDVFKRIMEKYPEDIAPMYQPLSLIHIWAVFGPKGLAVRQLKRYASWRCV